MPETVARWTYTATGWPDPNEVILRDDGVVQHRRVGSEGLLFKAFAGPATTRLERERRVSWGEQFTKRAAEARQASYRRVV